jgi:glycosyltransferase involved in cell wall biosynthesis
LKLAILSHTEHYKTADGTIVGWSPTVNEINHLLDVFDEIYHVAMLHEGDAPNSALAYTSSKITFVPLKPSGGRSLLSKFNTLLNAPSVITTVSKILKNVDYFQLRTPTGIGVYLIPYLTLFIKNKGWYKYAGNWNQQNPPLGYRLQRFMLKKQSRNVTINGQWPHQLEQFITFENPCLSNEDLLEGETIIEHKDYSKKLNFCYVGRLEKPKGVERLIKALISLSVEEKQNIGVVHLVGDGEDMPYFKSLTLHAGVDFVFHGFLSKQKVFEIYKQSHFFIMPTTASEGFPKVIAEAMNFGCIPLVSNVSAIGQYIKHQENGFVLEAVSEENLLIMLKESLKLNPLQYIDMVHMQRPIVKLFTFEHYNFKIKTEILAKK